MQREIRDTFVKRLVSGVSYVVPAMPSQQTIIFLNLSDCVLDVMSRCSSRS